MENNNNRHILCFGEILWDMLPSGPQPGGALLNVAIHLIRQGQTPMLISKIGNDKLGWDLIQFITEAGLDQSLFKWTKLYPPAR